jgi:nitroreductase
MDTWSGKASNETLEYLLKRRSVKADDLLEPGPSAAQLETILQAASRVPDHGKVVPFYFLVFGGDARLEAGNVFAEIYAQNNPDAEAAQIERERNRFMRVPLVIGLVMRMRKSKKPMWEQLMTVGAASQNLLLAANAQGFGAQWLTEWYAYDEAVCAKLGLDETDAVGGFFYIGTPPDGAQEERPRPDLNAVVNHWSPDAAIKKGDEYHLEKYDYPETGVGIISKA